MNGGAAAVLECVMEVILQPNVESAALLAARLIADELRSKPAAVLGLATGRTMEAVYALLSEMHRQEALDFSACRTFNLDEYLGVPSNDRHSYRHYMNEHLFAKVNIALRNTHLPNGMAADLQGECAHYEKLIADAGRIDLQLLGIGNNGHLGFNEPLSSFNSRTRVVTLAPETLEQNARFFGGPEFMPKQAITMGVGTILESRHCVLLATGQGKASILAQAVEGPITSMISATALQLHPNCIVVADEAAAGKLQRANYYRAQFEHDPKWRTLETPLDRQSTQPRWDAVKAGR